MIVVSETLIATGGGSRKDTRDGVVDGMKEAGEYCGMTSFLDPAIAPGCAALGGGAIAVQKLSDFLEKNERYKTLEHLFGRPMNYGDKSDAAKYMISQVGPMCRDENTRNANPNFAVNNCVSYNGNWYYYPEVTGMV